MVPKNKELKKRSRGDMPRETRHVSFGSSSPVRAALLASALSDLEAKSGWVRPTDVRTHSGSAGVLESQVIAPTGWGDTRSGGRTVQAPSVMMARFECNDTWNTMSPALMLACCSNLQEPQTPVSTHAMTAGDMTQRQRSSPQLPPRRRPTGRKSKDQRRAEDDGTTLDAIATSEHEPFAWRQEWRRDKLQGAYEVFGAYTCPARPPWRDASSYYSTLAWLPA